MKFGIVFSFLILTIPSYALKHVVFVVGTDHYSPQLTMPKLAKQVNEKFTMRTTVILPEGNVEQNKNGIGLRGLEALRDADLAVFFVRFMALPPDQMRFITDYVEAGKPVMGIRTATHAFKYERSSDLSKWNTGFGADVLGTKYRPHLKGGSVAHIIPEKRDHPILTGVKESFKCGSSVYPTEFSDGVVPILRAKGTPSKDWQKDTYDVAWTWKNKWGGKVFTTTIGHPDDLRTESGVRILINAIHWLVDEPVPGPGVKVEPINVKVPKKKKGKKPKKKKPKK